MSRRYPLSVLGARRRAELARAQGALISSEEELERAEASRGDAQRALEREQQRRAGELSAHAEHFSSTGSTVADLIAQAAWLEQQRRRATTERQQVERAERAVEQKRLSAEQRRAELATAHERDVAMSEHRSQWQGGQRRAAAEAEQECQEDAMRGGRK